MTTNDTEVQQLARDVLCETLHGHVPMQTVARLAEELIRIARLVDELRAEIAELRKRAVDGGQALLGPEESQHDGSRDPQLTVRWSQLTAKWRAAGFPLVPGMIVCCDDFDALVGAVRDDGCWRTDFVSSADPKEWIQPGGWEPDWSTPRTEHLLCCAAEQAVGEQIVFARLYYNDGKDVKSDRWTAVLSEGLIHEPPWGNEVTATSRVECALAVIEIARRRLERT